MSIDTYKEFEALVHEFLVKHPAIRYEWKQIPGCLDGRTDLICEPGTSKEVFATLRNGQIVVGTKNEDTDFEDFGRRLSDKEIALEAFEHFINLLKDNEILK